MTKLLLINNDENAILHSVEDKLLRMQHLHNEKKIIEAEYSYSERLLNRSSDFQGYLGCK